MSRTMTEQYGQQALHGPVDTQSLLGERGKGLMDDEGCGVCEVQSSSVAVDSADVVTSGRTSAWFTPGSSVCWREGVRHDGHVRVPPRAACQ